MRLRHSLRTTLIGLAATGIATIGVTTVAMHGAAATVPLAFESGRVSIAGTSNIHEYTASTTAVRVTRVQLASTVGGPNFWNEIVKPGAVEAFEVAIAAASLSSPKEGLDKNMHKALKTEAHQDITFRLLRLEPRVGSAGALRAVGVLRIAGVEREVGLDLTAERKDAGLAVHGELQILMTDFGIAPPKAMLGMLKTDPKVTITFDTVLGVPLT
jgi:polyisoprenoid-binding protein YceI